MNKKTYYQLLVPKTAKRDDGENDVVKTFTTEEAALSAIANLNNYFPDKGFFVKPFEAWEIADDFYKFFLKTFERIELDHPEADFAEDPLTLACSAANEFMNHLKCGD